VSKLFKTEAELVERFCAILAQDRYGNGRTTGDGWTAYHETADWDVLLAHTSGAQIGIEAKLSLNPKVLEQALPTSRWHATGPDFRAVLVPHDGLQHHMHRIAEHLGIVVISVQGMMNEWTKTMGWSMSPYSLPDLDSFYSTQDWPAWWPSKRCPLPDYVPDVAGGRAAPLQLTEWKIKAIKLMIVLERRGFVTRRDMEALRISPTLWTKLQGGLLARGVDGYIRCPRTPNFKAEHPTNYAQIEADIEVWGKEFDLTHRAGGLV
jgi:hypothetical protein